MQNLNLLPSLLSCLPRPPFPQPAPVCHTASVVTALSGNIAPTSSNTFSAGPFLNGTLIEPVLTFHDNTAIDMLVTVDGAGTYTVSESSASAMHNLTGTAWTGFRMDLVGASDSADTFVAGSAFDGANLLNVVNFSNGNQTINYSAGTGVPDGSFFQPNLV